MIFTKPKIYNLALSALLLAKEVVDVETDKSNEVKVLNLHYDIALESTLEDLDLDGTSLPVTLELLSTLTGEPWDFVYKYPTNCVFFRRIVSLQATDCKATHIDKRTGVYNGQKAIYTNEVSASAEIIPKDLSLAVLSPMAGLAVSYKLAYLAAPLIVGKGAKKLREEIMAAYVIAKVEAQEKDSRENFMYDPDWVRSEFVLARFE